MVSVNISYFSFRKSALLDSLWVPLSFGKISCPECKGASPISGAWPFGASLCASVFVACGDVIEKHVDGLFLRSVCFPRANISITVSLSDSLKSVKFLYWYCFILTDTLLSAIYVNYLNDFRLYPVLKRSRSREIWSRAAFSFMKYNLKESNSVLSCV